jgi:hypothetical protein
MNGSATGGGTSPTFRVSISFYRSDYVQTGTTTNSFAQLFTDSAGLGNLSVGATTATCPPRDAAFIQTTVTVATGAGSSGSNIATVDLVDFLLITGKDEILVAESNDPNTYAPGSVIQTDGRTVISANSIRLNCTTEIIGSLKILNEAGSSLAYESRDIDDTDAQLTMLVDGKMIWGPGGTTSGDTNLYRSAADTLKTDDSFVVAGNIGVDGRIYFDSALTGPYIQQAGTNGRIISVANATSTDGVDLVASTSSSRSGIMITKSVTGQPTTNLNGTGATDAFADVLRNGGIALDVTNNRGYFYSSGWKYAALTTPSDSRLKQEISEITDALDTLRQLVPVAFKWKRPEAHGRTDCVTDDGTRLGFIADQVATTDLAHWVETLGVDEREADLVDTDDVLAVNIPQNEMEALVVQALLDIDTRLKALESR